MENSLSMHVPDRILKIGDKTYRLSFDMLALSHAEQVYLQAYGVHSNCGHIVAELSHGSATALMAMTYGAMRSAGEKMTWEQFAREIFTFEHFDAVYEVVSDALCEMLGLNDQQDKKGAEDTAKN